VIPPVALKFPIMSLLKIAGGERKGFRLKVPRGAKPTSSFMRKVIFDTLGNLVEGRKVLELFAGSGALALEALSRGASSAVLVDISRGAFHAIRDNIRHLGYGEKAEVFRGDAVKFIRKLDDKFDLILADPPYDYEHYEMLLKELRNVVSPDGIVVLEVSSRMDLKPQKWGFRIWKEKKGGDTRVYFLVPMEGDS